MDMQGRIIWVTGAASGLGLATARALAAAGATVVVSDLDVQGGERAAEELGGTFIATDVADLDSNLAAVASAVEQHGGLDGAYLNAGVTTGCGVGEDFELAKYRRIFGANIDGVAFGTHAVLPALRARGGGAIVATASLAGLTGVALDPLYSATKHAVVGLSESVRAELRGRNVDISCVMPTIVNTELTAGVAQKWVKPVEATDVAAAIVGALETPRFDVYVPKSNGALLRSANLMPRAAAEWVGRAMGTDKLMTEVDEGARADYEARVTRSGGEAKADDTESSPTEERTS